VLNVFKKDFYSVVVIIFNFGLNFFLEGFGFSKTYFRSPQIVTYQVPGTRSKL
jgi:hypothetical protein